jgi:tetrahydromethanopterin S-methyltransferase subunit B
MHEELNDRIAELKREIEALRGELRHAVLREASSPGKEGTFAIADRLDRLIVEFMKVRDQVDEAHRD